MSHSFVKRKYDAKFTKVESDRNEESKIILNGGFKVHFTFK